MNYSQRKALGANGGKNNNQGVIANNFAQAVKATKLTEAEILKLQSGATSLPGKKPSDIIAAKKTLNGLGMLGVK